VFFRNQMVEPRGTYTYDALYRLIEADGRESYQPQSAPNQREGAPASVTFSVTAQTLRNYTQTYAYDSAGNLVDVRHLADQGDWHRRFEIALDSNQLVHTWEGADLYTDPGAINKTEYSADAHGNMLNLASVAPDLFVSWDHRDMIDRLDLEGGGWVYYQYDAAKQRTRKRLERLSGTVEERIYLGGYELYRRYRASDPTQLVEEIESFHLIDGQSRVLLIDDVLTPSGAGDPRPDGLTVPSQTLFRYQYSNDLGSTSLELDDQQQIITYEEFHPYGTSAFRTSRDGSGAPPKRYRYTGMERDEESGLGYHSARYYAPWLWRWIRPDPTGTSDGLNVFAYCRCSPVTSVDREGRQAGTFLENLGGFLWGAGQSIAAGPVEFFMMFYEGSMGVQYKLGAPNSWLRSADFRIAYEHSLQRQETMKGFLDLLARGPGATTQALAAGVLAPLDEASKHLEEGNGPAASEALGRFVPSFMSTVSTIGRGGSASLKLTKDLAQEAAAASTAQSAAVPAGEASSAINVLAKGEEPGAQAGGSLADAAVRREYLASQGVKSAGQLTFKSRWNLEELRANATIMRLLDVVSFGQAELFEVTKGGKTSNLRRIVDNLVLVPKSGQLAVLEYSTHREFIFGERKFAQLERQVEAFGRARSGQSSIIARIQGGGDVFDVTNAKQIIGTYPHWNPREDIAALAKELGLQNPYR
jgi:RHS repeat-associated protein